MTDRVLLLKIDGKDVGEHGELPMKALAGMLPAQAQVELFIDAGGALGVSTDVSAGWAIWLSKHRDAFSRINMLTGSTFVQLTASFIRRWADIGEIMHVYTDASAFEAALSARLIRASTAR
jgi:hypothetical protein